ncbi:MAG: DUF2288 domain-containing protein [Deltaproteobacteria bacterium]|nr:DUF2288 domain-containing protein [Deltaproteobacteria bacterium]
MTNNTENLREKLEKEVGPADWKVIGPHYTRGAVIIVSSELDLIDVAIKVAQDDVDLVQDWIKEEKLLRPTPDDAKEWKEKGIELSSIVVSPFVLVQQLKH